MASKTFDTVSVLSLALAAKLKSQPGITAPTEIAKVESTLPSTDPDRAGLLTPPNSISPILPPQLKSQPLSACVDSDVDLQTAVDHAKEQSQSPHLARLPEVAPSESDAQDSEDAITPSVLAEFHLPHILLGKGPIAIRYIMGYLSQSIPGFAQIPPAKARRIIVSALEGRYHGASNREVIYDKVGWGRWEARTKGQPMPSQIRPPVNTQRDMSPPASIGSSSGSSHMAWIGKNRRSSWLGESVMTPPAEEVNIDMAGHEADKMSLDGSSGSDSEAVPSDDSEATEEEDWAAIGADALRNGWHSKSYGSGSVPSKQTHHPKHLKASTRYDRIQPVARSAPSSHSYGQPYMKPLRKTSRVVHVSAANLKEQSAQDRAAAEALLKMVSM
ncbi:MAG: DNA-binding proteins Bright/BRCAA1/RBP1 and proteins containing BRIGHT domain [Bogoriella megaspora]|nr:MAG: DNA-binding proteins Bright/BRCAA1/RBP1 and proteins containing BRIGHT domain [Bogoriella megaspora]